MGTKNKVDISHIPSPSDFVRKQEIEKKQSIAQEASQEVPQESSFISDIGDTAMGVGQGLTLDFMDELGGAIKSGAVSAKDLLEGKNVDWEKVKERYRQAQEEIQARDDLAKERSPWLHGGGALVGGIAGVVGNPAFAAERALVRGAEGIVGKTLGKDLTKAGLKALAKTEGTKTAIGTALGGLGGAGYEAASNPDASFVDVAKSGVVGALGGAALSGSLGRSIATKAAIEGVAAAPIGAAMGAGGSKGQLGSDEMIEDAKEAAKTAGILSTGINLAGAAGSALKNRLKDDTGYSLLNKVKASYDSPENLVVLSDDGMNKIQERAIDAARNTSNKISKSLSDLGDKIGETIRTGPKEIANFNNQDLFNLNNITEIVPNFAKKAENIVPGFSFKVQNPNTFTPNDIWNLRKYIDEANLGSHPDPIIANSFKDLRNSLKSLLENNVPGFADASSNYLTFKNATHGEIAALGDVPNIANTYVRSTPDQILSNLKDVYTKASKGGVSSLSPSYVKGKLVKNIQELEGLPAFREILEKNKLTADTVGKEMTRGSAEFGAMIDSMKMSDASNHLTSVGGAYNVTKSGTIKAANAAGQAVRKLKDLSPEFLKKAAEKLKLTPGVSHLGTALQDSMESNDLMKKATVMFAIKQNKAAREELRKMGIDTDDNK